MTVTMWTTALKGKDTPVTEDTYLWNTQSDAQDNVVTDDDGNYHIQVVRVDLVVSKVTNMPDLCAHCSRPKADCSTHCHEVQDGVHLPCPISPNIDQDAGKGRGVAWVVDISCQNCDVGGTTLIDHDNISWK